MTEPASHRQPVASHAFLSGLGERHRLLLASRRQAVHGRAGRIAAREGEPAKPFYLIQAGHVAIGMHTPERGVVPIQTVGPGEIVGWSWLVPPYRWQFDCRAVECGPGAGLRRRMAARAMRSGP